MQWIYSLNSRNSYEDLLLGTCGTGSVGQDRGCSGFCLTFVCFVFLILRDDGWTQIPR